MRRAVHTLPLPCDFHESRELPAKLTRIPEEHLRAEEDIRREKCSEEEDCERDEEAGKSGEEEVAGTGTGWAHGSILLHVGA